MSVIETPPEDRLPIQTRVAEASAGLVRDAILRELDRGGQVFYVHNRVETIEAQAEQLRRMLPGARFVVGHGQMPEGQLERVMLKFAGGEADVLVCTTIIESGLDIPNANTIIIDRADTLGLAQLYQLRGRVGRSSRRAYAYLLYRRRERMSEEARKRLQAIFNASELGAGFQIALSDLEIRGAGNILGGEQSGHMAAVGFDLYSRLLAEAVEERKAQREDRPPQVEQAAGRRRPAGRGAPARTTTCPRRPRSSSCTGAWRGPARPATSPRSARRSPTGSARCRSRSCASSRSPSCGSPPRRAGVASMSREEGQLVVRFGEGLSRATAMRLLAGGGLPGVEARRRHVRLEPGPDPPAARPVAGVGADAGGRRAAQRGRGVTMPPIRLDVAVDSDDELAALRGALLAARASELAEARRRGDRLSFGYGSDTAREGMSAEVAQARRRYEMLDRLLAALDAATKD